MIISLGYLKDCIAFTHFILFFFYIYYFKLYTNSIFKLILMILLLGILIDGSFTYYPWLHNYEIKL